MNHSTQAHLSQQEVVSFRASAVEKEEEEGGRLLTLSLLAAVSLLLPHKKLPGNALVPPCSLYCLSQEQGTCVFCLAFHLSKHTSLCPCPIYAPHTSLGMERYL